MDGGPNGKNPPQPIANQVTKIIRFGLNVFPLIYILTNVSNY